MESAAKYLIINADDFGYFDCVSRGIMDLASQGVVTATGIMANGSHFDACLETISAVSALDLGVHLNITYGTPLTGRMASLVEQWGGRFPGKYQMGLGILSGRIGICDIEREWRAQIVRCLDSGITLRFLNSHEHIHMLPPLYRMVQRLAREFSIHHVRYTGTEWGLPLGAAAVARNMVMQICNTMITRPREVTAIRLLGLNRSGKLDSGYLHQIFSGLSPGGIYELMCHPGHLDSTEIKDSQLLSYHRWEQELDLLGSPRLPELCQQHDVRLVGYRNLPKLKNRGNYSAHP